ncbi:MAG: LTA synthase family protein [Bacteroidota bacterium]
MITVTEIAVYSEWKTKLHYKALLYILHPAEIVSTAQTWQLIVFGLFFIGQLLLIFWIYRKFVFKRISIQKRNYIFSAIFFLLTPILLFGGIRGGIQQIPINQSQSYFSKYEILNLTSVNSGWNLVSSIQQNFNLFNKNPYQYYELSEAKKIVKELYTIKNDSTIYILKNKRPNIVMFILEGWASSIIESQGEKEITPFFHELEKNGVLFSNIYSSGTRSQEGMTAIFSGFPSQTITTITQQPEKYIKLASINKRIKEQGYYSSFYFGGQLIYGNIKGYLSFNEIDKIQEGIDFPSSIPRGKLGIHDEFTFPYFLSELNKQRQPFFSSIFTMSTHSPYDFKMKARISWPEYEKEYVNSAYYSDNCLKNFFLDARKQSWYNNTLFILISDHGHGSYPNYGFCSPEYHKIVFLMAGNVIKDEFKGLKIAKLGSQVDLSATLLGQLGLTYNEFEWSKNLLQPACPEFAFYAFDNAYGLVRPGAAFVFDARSNTNCLLRIDSTTTITESVLQKQARSYMQCVFQEYMDY